jgi:hypothetical protein
LFVFVACVFPLDPFFCFSVRLPGELQLEIFPCLSAGARPLSEVVFSGCNFIFPASISSLDLIFSRHSVLDLGSRIRFCPSWCRSVSDPVFSVVDLGPRAVLCLTRWISATVISIGEFSFVCLVYLLLPSTCFELQVTVLFLGSWILVGFWSFVPISCSRRPDFVFLWLAVACSVVLPCRKTVPLVPLPAGHCASRSSVTVAA